MCEEGLLFEHILRHIAKPKDLSGKKILVTAGATMEAIDPVRYITNHSTGKMGTAIAYAAMQRGADVTLVAAHMEVAPPPFVEVVHTTSAKDMAEAVLSRSAEMDIIIKSAAVADYTPKMVADEKIKKSGDDMSIELERTQDILAALGSQKRDGQIICGFSMETSNLLENSRAKLEKKNADIIAANCLKTEGAGFGVDTNVLTLISRNEVVELPKMSKHEAADKLLDFILNL